MNRSHFFLITFALIGLADTLSSALLEYTKDMATVFGSDYTPTQSNIVKAFLGFDFLTFALMETLAVRQEMFILNSYVFPEKSCADLADIYLLKDMAEAASHRLKNTQALLVHQRVQNDCCTRETETFMGGSHASNQFVSSRMDTTKERHWVVYKSKRVGDVGDVVERIRAEREHDILQFSYPIGTYLQYFEDYENFSIAMCVAVRTNPVVRTRFETDDILIEDFCKPINQPCLADIDCCSDVCQDNLCYEPFLGLLPTKDELTTKDVTTTKDGGTFP